jgi:hypothetical protein
MYLCIYVSMYLLCKKTSNKIEKITLNATSCLPKKLASYSLNVF